MPTNHPQQETEPMQGTEPFKSETPESGVAHSAKVREQNPDIDETGLKDLTAGNSAFAFDIYQAMREGVGTIYFSHPTASHWPWR